MRNVAWSEQAEAALMPAAFGDMEIIRAEVLQGVSLLWHSTGATEGWMVTRQEATELVIVAGAGTSCRALIRHAAERARAAGLTVRAHVRRPGMKRIFEREGFALREYVMGA